MPTIDYFFTSVSPFVYLGHEEIRSVAGRHAISLRARPVDVREVWTASGAVPLGERPELLRNYRIIELKRIAERRGLAINVRPKFFPVDPSFADLCTAVIVERGENPLDFMETVFTGVWVREEDISDKVQVAEYLAKHGHDADSIVQAAEAPETAMIRRANAVAAIAAGLRGVPGYVWKGEPFFGQDRIDDLEHALDTGRAPFTAD